MTLCQAAVGLAVGGFADRAIARGVPVARLRKGLQTVAWTEQTRSGGREESKCQVDVGYPLVI